MRLGIVIPTLNEAGSLQRFLPPALALGDEVWVSDGASQDGTAEMAERLGARVVSGPAGRGPQLNRGAAACSCEALLFLHADTRLPPQAPDSVRKALQAGAVGGGFQLRFDDPKALMRLGGRLINLRTALTGWPLGDQAQFVHRRAFESLEGYRDWPILEDLDFIRRLRRVGRTAVLSPPIVTAARRYAQQGVPRTIATNWLIWGLYLVGVSPTRLARLYRQIR